MQVGLNANRYHLDANRFNHQRHLHGEDYQENTRRWKTLSKYEPLHEGLKIIAAVAIGIIIGCAAIGSSILCFWLGSTLTASVVILTSASVVVCAIVAVAGAILTIKNLSRIFDETRYSKPQVASQISINLATCSLRHFHLYYANKLNNLRRYGFITKDFVNRIKYFLSEKIKLEKKIDANQHLINLPPQIRNQPEMQTAIEQYDGYRDQLRILEQEYIEFRDNVMAPQLPFPSSWRFDP